MLYRAIRQRLRQEVITKTGGNSHLSGALAVEKTLLNLCFTTNLLEVASSEVPIMRAVVSSSSSSSEILPQAPICATSPLHWRQQVLIEDRAEHKDLELLPMVPKPALKAHTDQ